ncbi:MAG: SAM-dependent DNA methyltransferase [Ignavibacteriaceae bacterium]|nr:SAM-dependent DNA methyltransferase [Ignavibacteriaceae bacterium]
MNKKLLKDLITTQDIKNLEKHLIFSFLRNINLDYSRSDLLKNYFTDFERDTKLYFDTSALNIDSVKELENYLELIIPEKDKKFNGAFFTPTYIIDFIISEIGPKESDKNIDPSCGSGAFLLGLVEYYKNKYRKPIKKTIKENVFGSDILDYNINRAKLLLTIYALQHNEIIEEKDFNLFCQDSLRTEWKDKFDNVVGNPPYVKFQDLSDKNRQFLVRHWKTIEQGTFNLYFAFFELGYKLLSDTGKLGYITPNNYFTSLAGESLRIFFQNHKCVERIIDFNHKKVFDVQTYTAITILNKKQNDIIFFDRIKENEEPEEFLMKVNGSPNAVQNLNYKKWRLLKSDEQENIRLIETIGIPIKKLFDINVGIATLKDELYFIDGKTEKGKYLYKATDDGVFEIEKEITRPIYKISDFKSQDEISLNSRRIICPFKIKNNVAIPILESEMQKKYPKCYKYFLSIKGELIKRDKGKNNYEPFYVWGRTQGLTKTGKKLLTPTFSSYPRFLLVEEDDAFFTNGYGIYFKKFEDNYLAFSDSEINQLTRVENIRVVQKILNSYVMHYYISKTSVAIEGGYPCYQKNFIERFTIPEFSENEIEELRELTDKNEIDNFLIEKYQLKMLAPNLSV